MNLPDRLSDRKNCPGTSAASAGTSLLTWTVNGLVRVGLPFSSRTRISKVRSGCLAVAAAAEADGPEGDPQALAGAGHGHGQLALLVAGGLDADEAEILRQDLDGALQFLAAFGGQIDDRDRDGVFAGGRLQADVEVGEGRDAVAAERGRRLQVARILS